MSDWISTKSDKRPEEEAMVLAVDLGDARTQIMEPGLYREGRIYQDDNSWKFTAFDYWLPIPPLPKAAGGEA